MGDLSGKTILITGANSGIGLAAAEKLARRGAVVVMVARDAAKGEAAVAAVRARAGSQTVSLLLCDFSSQASIRAMATAFRASHSRLDVLVNNAGSVSDTRQVTVDGIEQTFAVNHLGYFLLTNLLLDLLVKSAPSRVVITASVGHRQGTMDFDDLGFERGYGILKAYARSKLANVMFANELARRLAGSGVIVNSLHPGTVSTSIWSHAPRFAQPLLAIGKLFMVSAETGGARLEHLAASPEIAGKTGGYYEKNQLSKPMRLARDEALGKRLWDESSKLVGL